MDGQWEHQRIHPEAQGDEPSAACECPSRHAFRRNLYNWFVQLVDAALGLDYMHSLELVHGDLQGVS